MDHTSVVNDIKKGNFKPIYLLHGEEDYFIDKICDALEEHVLEEHERDFNMSVNYGLDTEKNALIAECRSYPMMAERRLVILKEAQKFKDFKDLEHYTQNPTETTVFVICYKHKKVAKNLNIHKNIKKHGMVFESPKLRDYEIPRYIQQMTTSMGYKISDKAVKMLSDNLGSDLSRISGELAKLSILVEKGSLINEVHIEENIGISKDYNVFELSNALAARNVPLALKIADHMSKNMKANPFVLIMGSLFRLHTQWMRLHFVTGDNMNKARVVKASPKAIPFMERALKIYPPRKISANIDILHEYDLKSKGMNSNTSEGELLKELVYKLMH